MIVPGVCASLCAGAVMEKGAFLLERKKEVVQKVTGSGKMVKKFTVTTVW